MDKLRLVVTDECSRKCPGFCMNPPPIDPKSITLKEVHEHPAKEVYVTGGEPFCLDVSDLMNILSAIDSKKVFLYSAYTGSIDKWFAILPYVDGITFTIHSEEDWKFFQELNKIVLEEIEAFGNLFSLWLNVFNCNEEECQALDYTFSAWTVRKKEWTVECSVPEGEDFRKLVR